MIYIAFSVDSQVSIRANTARATSLNAPEPVISEATSAVLDLLKRAMPSSTAPVSSTFQVVQWEYETSLNAGNSPGAIYSEEVGHTVDAYFVGLAQTADNFDSSGFGGG